MNDRMRLNKSKTADGGSAIPDAVSISFLDIIQIIVKRRKFIISFTFIISVLTVIALFIFLKLPPEISPLPDYYEPSVQVLLRTPSSDNSQAVSLGQLSSLTSLAGGNPLSSSSQTSADLVTTLLFGNTIIERINDEFDLLGHYNIETSKYPLSDIKDKYSKKLKTNFDENTEILTVRFRDINKEFATQLVNRLVQLAQVRFNDITDAQTQAKLRLTEEGITVAEQNLKAAQDKLVAFQFKYGVFDMNIQTEQNLRTITQMNSEILQKQIQLEGLKLYLKDDDPQVVRLKNDINLSKKLLDQLKTGLGGFTPSGIPQNKLPEVAAEYLMIKGEVTIQETIYANLRQQYETMKIEGIANARTFNIIEPARILEKKSGPARSTICIISAIAAFFLAIFFSFIDEYIKNAALDPRESIKLDNIKSMLRRKKRTV